MPELNGTILKNSANLKAYYRFESGALTTDSSGVGNTLTNNGTVATGTGVYGGAAELGTANTTKYFSIASAIVSPVSDFTVSLWVKLNTEISTGVYDFFHLEDNTSKHVLYLHYQYNGGTRRVAFAQDRWVLAGYPVNYNITLGTANWYHLTMTKSGTTLRGYINGTHVGAVTVDNTAGTTATNTQTTIGAGTTVGTGTIINYSNALIDDVAIFNTALSADQIKELYEGRILGEFLPSQFGTMVGLWHLNGNSTDFSGNHNHGTDSNVTYSQAGGKLGQGAVFNGSTSKITVGTSNTLNLTGDQTYLAWIKPTDGGEGGYGQLYQRTTGTDGVDWSLRDDGTINDGMLFAARGGTTVNSNANCIAYGTWQHVAVVRSGTTVTFYVNGTPAGGGTISSITSASGGTAVIGNNPATTATFNGSIDEMAICSTALTANQIRQIYAYQKGLLGRYA